MLEELLLNDRRGNLIQGLQPKSIFLYGCKKPYPKRDTPKATRTNHCAMSHLLSQTATDYILATSFISERAIDHSKMMNESVKKVT